MDQPKKDFVKNRLKELFKKTIESKLRYNGKITDIDHFNLSYQAANNNSMFRLLESNLFMFNTTYEGKQAVLMIFSIPIKNDSGTKHIAEKVMEIITTVEKYFITLDYSNSQEIKGDKFIYITLVKKYDNIFLNYLNRNMNLLQYKGKKKAKRKGASKNEKKSSEDSSEVSS